MREHRRHFAVQRLSGFGEPQAAGRALDEARSELRLEPRYRCADAGLRPAQHTRRTTKAPMLDNVAENIEVIPVHRSV